MRAAREKAGAFGTRRKRLWLLFLVLLLLAIGGFLLVRAFGTGASTRTSLWPNGGDPTFLPPPGWQVYHLNSAGSSFTSPAAFLSNRPLHLGWPPGCMPEQAVDSCAPAVPTTLVSSGTGLADCTPHDTVTVCSPDPGTLARGQAIVSWVEVDSLPGGGSYPAPGTHMTVDGHEARLTVRTRKLLSCPPRSSESIIGRVYYQPSGLQRPRYSTWFEMDACLRGPNLAHLQAQVLRIFRSIRGI